MSRSLRIAKLLVASKFTNKSPEEISLGDGLVFAERTRSIDGSSQWELYDEDNPKNVYGYVLTHNYSKIGHTIGHISVEAFARGKGLGEKMVRALVNTYGSLTSDPGGDTSYAAVRMWERMGAEKVLTNKNSRGYVYRLMK